MHANMFCCGRWSRHLHLEYKPYHIDSTGGELRPRASSEKLELKEWSVAGLRKSNRQVGAFELFEEETIEAIRKIHISLVLVAKDKSVAL